MSIAIFQFPGSNCETETCETLHSLGISFELVPWNSTKRLSQYDGFILPGGFSFQDRIRAGVIAAKLPIIKQLKIESKETEKPVLGICNGAQILIESGLFSENDEIIDFNYVSDQMIGFVCDWGFLSPFNNEKNIFLKRFSEDDILPIQICHGEGRFMLNYTPVSGMKYTTIDGQLKPNFPITPNGAQDGIGAISNQSGNALAIMPHPERSTQSNRYPFSIQSYAKKNNINLVNFSDLFKVFQG